jgi:hypothetical protein
VRDAKLVSGVTKLPKAEHESEATGGPHAGAAVW